MYTIGVENENPLQYPCLENFMDRGAWRATVHGVAKSWTRLSNWEHLHVCIGICIFSSILRHAILLVFLSVLVLMPQSMTLCKHINLAIFFSLCSSIQILESGFHTIHTRIHTHTHTHSHTHFFIEFKLNP